MKSVRSDRVFLKKKQNTPILLHLVRAGTLAVTFLLLFSLVAPGNLLSEAAAFFIPQLIAAGFVGLLIWLVMARRLHWLHLLCLLGLIISSFWMVTSIRLVRQPTAILENHPESKSFNVMSLNLLHMQFGKEALQELIEKRQPDLIVFQETASATPRLQAFLRENYQYAILPPEKKDTDLTVFSKFPLENSKRNLVPGLGFNGYIPREFLSADVNVNGRKIQLYAIHPASPRSKRRLNGRTTYVDYVSKHIQKHRTDTPIMVLGDWNTPVWSDTFQKLLADLKLKTTFTSFVPQTTRYFINPFLGKVLGSKVDHITSSEKIIIKDLMIGEDVGSDHFPIFATLHILP
ncbi:endonuclease/exonuclease/phosphatase family protein [Pseudovibrio brasiliensis]|uniref:Endonuclease/exonuclease/phosphatase family protein n=1 Tax=Pseudovibrio brasiliensis TaxID=1898042 RepID=A0ABX8AJ67_9HYPH|nr:endonuclease/exonuclease/phosphatase family protein [Pseudovibrio brasiliensis]